MLNQSKIVLVIADIQPTGGSFSYLRDLIYYLQSRKWTTFLSIEEHNFTSTNGLLINSNVNYFREISLPHNIQSVFPLSLVLGTRFFHKLICKIEPDLVVVCTSVPGKYIGVPFLSEKCIYILNSYPTTSKNPFHGLESLIIRYTLKSTTTLISVSSYAANQANLFWNIKNQLKEKSIRLPSGVKDSGHVNNQSFSDTSKIQIFSAGTVIDYKNVDLWLQLAKDVTKTNHDVTFLWHGDGPRFSDIKNKIYTNNLDSRVKLLPFVPSLVKVFQKSQIYFQPSKIESQGLTVVEAMSHGLPCVVSNHGGLPELIEHGKTGFIVNIDNYEEVKMAIETLINDKILRQKMGKAARQKYLDEYTIGKWENRLDNLLDRILGYH